ncbi:MAG TPA: HDOD domain-containing protein [Terracidiphilus sp.]|jgi:EAL and modified HD-GYP domain-containing signal transduction protein|nr:HDOD domain-containing protein [Terracidiphilus sp.]
MATKAAAVECPAAVMQEKTNGLRYVARQPILDLHGQVHAYELLFRSGPDQVFRGDGNLATRTMLDNTLVFGLERLTGGATAFVNCTQESLTDSLVEILPPSMCVLEILETLEPTPELVNACKRLKKAGFRLALDDFIWKPGYEPLVELADYIKVDFILSDERERHELLKRLHGAPVTLLAEKIETQEQYRQARMEGFTLTQGYYFCRPELMENRKIPSNRITQIEILRLLRQETFDLQELCPLVKQDTSLTYRLLRLINSPIYGMRQQINSVNTALMAVGEIGFRRIATLAITSELNGDQPRELLRMAFIRARFCELAAGQCSMDATEQYLLGLLSLLPAMLRVPMKELTPSLPLREQVCVALMGAPVPERRLLDWLLAHEQGDWPGCDAIIAQHCLDGEALLACYEQAVVWAEAAVRFT